MTPSAAHSLLSCTRTSTFLVSTPAPSPSRLLLLPPLLIVLACLQLRQDCLEAKENLRRSNRDFQDLQEKDSETFQVQVRKMQEEMQDLLGEALMRNREQAAEAEALKNKLRRATEKLEEREEETRLQMEEERIESERARREFEAQVKGLHSELARLEETKQKEREVKKDT